MSQNIHGYKLDIARVETQYYLGFLSLWRSLLLGCQRVSKSTSNSDSRSQYRVSFHWFLEDNGRNDNNNDAFGCVKYGRSDGSNSCGECESKLIVDVEKESRH
mmetsp:Transcript_5095/g.5631  ORF Transcript_5095/g.5631 Transcript_5095/m.5631 type:complete len:103 (+) Transcript_5095:208-516(+)